MPCGTWYEREGACDADRIICPECAAIVLTKTRLSALLECRPDLYQRESDEVVSLNMRA
jgi:hypothetical protein